MRRTRSRNTYCGGSATDSRRVTMRLARSSSTSIADS
jgi:hypothetical protein